MQTQSRRLRLAKLRKDTLFASENAPQTFVFDDKVADVFADMIARSVPGYSTIIAMIGLLAQQHCKPDTMVYDLGCSLGAAAKAIRDQVPFNDYTIVAVDNSPAMISKLNRTLAPDGNTGPEIITRCIDLLDQEIVNGSVVVLNFTLQFVPLADRDRLLRQIYDGMVSGGVLIISEKICFQDPSMEALMVDAYHAFKQSRGYSRLEIAKKRAALENVLLPESLAAHKTRLGRAGFETADVWFQCFNFASLVAIK